MYLHVSETNSKISVLSYNLQQSRGDFDFITFQIHCTHAYHHHLLYGIHCIEFSIMHIAIVVLEF